MTGLLTNDQRLTKGSAENGLHNLLGISVLTGMTGKPNLFWVSHTLYNTIPYKHTLFLYCLVNPVNVVNDFIFNRLQNRKVTGVTGVTGIFLLKSIFVLNNTHK